MNGPHQNQPVLHTGTRVEDASAVMIMIHGRGASARDILTLVEPLDRPDFAYLAPEAAGNTWYPQSFLAPIPVNEPGISSGIRMIRDLVATVEAGGMPAERIMLLGFSQGGCLASEFMARNPRRYGGLAALSAGLIGPPGTPRDYEGTLDGTPVFLGCSDVDSHIPKERVQESADVLERMGAIVTMKLYRGMDHTINEDEIAHVQRIMDAM